MYLNMADKMFEVMDKVMSGVYSGPCEVFILGEVMEDIKKYFETLSDNEDLLVKLKVSLVGINLLYVN